jgi:hypothetical protein
MMEYLVVFGFTDSSRALFVVPDSFGSTIRPQKVNRNGISSAHHQLGLLAQIDRKFVMAGVIASLRSPDLTFRPAIGAGELPFGKAALPAHVLFFLVCNQLKLAACQSANPSGTLCINLTIDRREIIDVHSRFLIMVFRSS